MNISSVTIPDYKVLDEMATASDFWDLYKIAKGKRNHFDLSQDIGPTLKKDRQQVKNQYDLYANVTSANLFLKYFAKTLEFEFSSFVWEYHLREVDENASYHEKRTYDSNVKNLQNLIQKSGGEDNLTVYLKNMLYENIGKTPNNEYKFLDGTNFALRFFDQNHYENYVVIPYRCFNDRYLQRCLSNAIVSRKNPNHGDLSIKRVLTCDLENDFHSLETSLSNTYSNAQKVLKIKYLPNCN